MKETIVSAGEMKLPDKSRDLRGEPYGLAIVGGFRARNMAVHSGNVPPDVVRQRRAKAKAARAARRKNR